LRLRSFTAACGLAAFTIFWTAISFRLAQVPFALDRTGIAIFSLVGATAALVAPIAGRLGDRGWSFAATLFCHGMIVVGFAVAAWDATETFAVAIGLLLLAAACLDIGVIGEQTIGRRSINLLNPEARGRLNAMFVGLFFLGGSLGPSLAAHAWASGGWSLVCAVGALFGVMALVLNLVWGRSRA
jgi:MFS family permease